MFKRNIASESYRLIKVSDLIVEKGFMGWESREDRYITSDGNMIIGSWKANDRYHIGALGNTFYFSYYHKALAHLNKEYPVPYNIITKWDLDKREFTTL
jgi:hypothetical protein